MKTKQKQTAPSNLESQTARRMIQILKKQPLDELCLDVVEAAIANEQQIVRLADRIAQTLSILARDYSALAEIFIANGAVALINPRSDLPELNAELRSRIEARKLYSNLL
ncbi:MAG TPA: hypothetical protein PLQ45_04865 [Anaerohalosphaeraceae bacterium]|nr:hypothetical protein [Anaerohalosphaeraceae bacterium]